MRSLAGEALVECGIGVREPESSTSGCTGGSLMAWRSFVGTRAMRIDVETCHRFQECP